MIRVDRDRLDSRKIQQDLEDVRLERLPDLRKLIRSGASAEEIKKIFTGYQIARKHLWESQHKKCCYCEKWDESSYNDVEHYRPKSVYWWLTFTWTNLLFACKQCNGSEKRAQFNLHSGKPLQPEEPAPGNEVPLLLDPSDTRINPVEHIEFVWKERLIGGPKRWVADARNGSLYGNESVVVYGLNRDDLFELRDGHVRKHVRPTADRLNRLLDAGNHVEAKHAFQEATAYFEPDGYFVALTYDAYRHYVPNERLKEIGQAWPEPRDVGLPRAPRPIRRERR